MSELEPDLRTSVVKQQSINKKLKKEKDPSGRRRTDGYLKRVEPPSHCVCTRVGGVTSKYPLQKKQINLQT
jgi:hypothetical protein